MFIESIRRVKDSETTLVAIKVVALDNVGTTLRVCDVQAFFQYSIKNEETDTDLCLRGSH